MRNILWLHCNKVLRWEVDTILHINSRQKVFWHHLGVLQHNSNTICLESASHPADLRTQSPTRLPHSRYQPQVRSPGHLHFRSLGCTFDGSQNALRFNNAKMTHRAHSKLYLWLQFSIKAETQKQPNEEMHRTRGQEGRWSWGCGGPSIPSPHGIWPCHPCKTSVCSPTRKLHLICV